MSGKDRVAFEFHVKSVRWVPAGEAAPSGGLELGSRDGQIPVEAELHPSPELDRLIRDARQAHEAERTKAAKGAQRRYVDERMTALGQPSRTTSNLSQPAQALYRNVLPPQQASVPMGGDAWVDKGTTPSSS